MTEAEFYNEVFCKSGQPLPLMKKKNERPWVIYRNMLGLKVRLISVSNGKSNRNLVF